MSRGNKEQLLDYLKTALDLETELMKLRRLKDASDRALNALSNKRYQEFIPPHSNTEINIGVSESKLNAASSLGSVVAIGAFIGAFVGVIYAGQLVTKDAVSLLAAFILMLVQFPFAALFCAVLFAVFGAIGGVAIGCFIEIPAYCANLRKKRMERERYIAENADAKRAWEVRHKAEVNRDREALSQFQVDSCFLNELICNTKRLLEEHYKDGPIYHKYQNLPAICQLYEYLDSGRFEKLGDAYNQYELEIRLGAIVNSLDTAIQLLSRIRDNQYLLYKTLLKIDKEISIINANLNDCIKKLDVISYAQEMTSIFTRQIALASTFLSQIEFYKNQQNLPFAFDFFEGYLLGANMQLEKRKRELDKQKIKV